MLSLVVSCTRASWSSRVPLDVTLFFKLRRQHNIIILTVNVSRPGHARPAGDEQRRGHHAASGHAAAEGEGG